MSYCNWKHTSPENVQYHDEEWGVPVKDDQKLFESLCLESFQCGLSWDIIMKKRSILREAFDHFDAHRMAAYQETDVERIMAIPGMIRSEGKIRGMVGNAKAWLQLQDDFCSASAYFWAYTNHKSLVYLEHHARGVPSQNDLSKKISKDLKRRGFMFIGPVTMYSFLQAVGIIQDHDPSCPRYQEICDSYEIQFIEG